MKELGTAFFLGFAALLLTGCDNCEDEAERKFGLLFYRNGVQEKPVFNEVYGLGGKGNIALGADSLYRLPISLHQDSSTYLLKNSLGEADTLTIRYKRDFFFQDKHCGFRVKFSDFASGASTTYDEVQVIGTENSGGLIFGALEDVYEVRIDL
jgi:hypothetical protein